MSLVDAMETFLERLFGIFTDTELETLDVTALVEDIFTVKLYFGKQKYGDN
jgi:hypothetical protein